MVVMDDVTELAAALREAWDAGYTYASWAHLDSEEPSRPLNFDEWVAFRGASFGTPASTERVQAMIARAQQDPENDESPSSP